MIELLKRILWAVILFAAAVWGWGQYQEHERAQRAAQARPVKKALPASTGAASVNFFTCDGRNQCKQMTSCEEAKYFVKNCGMNAVITGEGTQACERQWCH
jgi:hypothetical protein